MLLLILKIILLLSLTGLFISFFLDNGTVINIINYAVKHMSELSISIDT